jgi:DNA repair protein RadC
MLGTGVQGKGVLALARELLESIDLDREFSPTMPELRQINGMGFAKAAKIVAMLEFGKRFWGAAGQHVRSPVEAYELVRHWADRKREVFLALTMNGAHEVLGVHTITSGLVNRTLVHPREFFADAITDRAVGVVAAHNHPSGCVNPSEEDDNITQNLAEASSILGITLVDHIIFSETGFYSYHQSGKL